MSDDADVRAKCLEELREAFAKCPSPDVALDPLPRQFAVYLDGVEQQSRFKVFKKARALAVKLAAENRGKRAWVFDTKAKLKVYSIRRDPNEAWIALDAGEELEDSYE